MSAAPIIIGGCFRSGTSLVRRMLDAHSRIHCGPEVKFFRDLYGDYQSDDLAKLRFFGTARSLGVDDEELLSIFGRAFIETHDLAARKAGKVRWADKAPENALYMREWDAILDGELLFVHVIRHPLDTLASMVEAGFPRVLPASFVGKVDVYRHYVERGLQWADENPARSTTIRYEVLVAEPERVLTELLARIGESYEPQMVARFNEGRQSGLEDPKVKDASTVHGASIERWRNDLRAEEVNVAVRELGPLAQRLGYELPTAPPKRSFFRRR